MARTIEDYVTDKNIRLAVTEELRLTQDADGWEHFAGKVRLTMDGRRITTPWRQGTGHGDAAPTVASVLDALAADAAAYLDSRDFADFAANFGYSEDSRRAEKLYRECGKIAHRLSAFLTDAGFEEVVWGLDRL